MRMRSSSPADSGRRTASTSRRRRQGGNILVMFTIMLPFVLIPMVGLAIDATMMYNIKTKIQSAVDGGAIAAAQALSAGLTFTAQQAAAQKAADEFLKANLVAGSTPGSGYWGTFQLNDTTCDPGTNGGPGQPDPSGGSACIIAAQNTQTKVTTVTIAASVKVPLMFMRLLGDASATVAASGQASRRSVVLVMVIDRSSSMDHVIGGVAVMDTLQAAATWFTEQFQEGRDQLGLVTFGSSALVLYPPTDWNNTAPTGPDACFQGTNEYPSSASGCSGPAYTANSPNMVTSINNITIASNTGTAEGLMMAWKEIQAANQPGALNVIVLFTDGQPNGITANFNTNVSTAGPPVVAGGNGTAGSIIAAASTCAYHSVAPGSATSMLGWMSQWGGYVAGVNSAHGIGPIAQYDSTDHANVTAWALASGDPIYPNTANKPGSGCFYSQNSGTANNVPTDIKQIPAGDYYGNSTLGVNSGSYTTNDYTQAEIWGDAGECNNGSRHSMSAANLATYRADACQVGLASWNAADQAARQIHGDTVYSPVIYAMGFEGNGGDDPAFMTRLANLNTSTVYNANIPTGMYLQVQTPDDIAPAFQTVLAEVLRLSM